MMRANSNLLLACFFLNDIVSGDAGAPRGYVGGSDALYYVILFHSWLIAY